MINYVKVLAVADLHMLFRLAVVRLLQSHSTVSSQHVSGQHCIATSSVDQRQVEGSFTFQIRRCPPLHG